MTITASDNLLEAEAKVVIFIRDVNDLPPVFSNTTYEAFIFEEDPQVMKIMKVSESIFLGDSKTLRKQAIYKMPNKFGTNRARMFY